MPQERKEHFKLTAQKICQFLLVCNFMELIDITETDYELSFELVDNDFFKD